MYVLIYIRIYPFQDTPNKGLISPKQIIQESYFITYQQYYIIVFGQSHYVTLFILIVEKYMIHNFYIGIDLYQ